MTFLGLSPSYLTVDRHEKKLIIRKCFMSDNFKKNFVFFYLDTEFRIVIWKMEINYETIMKNGKNGRCSYSEWTHSRMFLPVSSDPHSHIIFRGNYSKPRSVQTKKPNLELTLEDSHLLLQRILNPLKEYKFSTRCFFAAFWFKIEGKGHPH